MTSLSTCKATDAFKAGTKEVYAFFEVGNMTKGLKWKTEWYYNGELVKGVGGTQTWTADESVKEFWLSLLDIGLSGTFELKLYIEDKLVQLGTFVIE